MLLPARQLISHFARAAFAGDLLTAHPNVYGVLSIGFDHDGACNGESIPQDRAEQLLDEDLVRVSEEVVRPLLMPKARAEMNANQLSALVSFAHSIGRRVFSDSTVLARVNSRRYIDVPAELLKHTHVAGKTMRVLVRRRLSEANLFCSFPGWMVQP